MILYVSVHRCRIFKKTTVSIKLKACIEQAAHFSAQLHSKDLILHKYSLTKGLVLILPYITAERPLSLISRQILPRRRRTARWRLPAVASINVTGKKKEKCHEKEPARLCRHGNGCVQRMGESGGRHVMGY